MSRLVHKCDYCGWTTEDMAKMIEHETEHEAKVGAIKENEAIMNHWEQVFPFGTKVRIKKDTIDDEMEFIMEDLQQHLYDSLLDYEKEIRATMLKTNFKVTDYDFYENSIGDSTIGVESEIFSLVLKPTVEIYVHPDSLERVKK